MKQSDENGDKRSKKQQSQSTKPYSFNNSVIESLLSGSLSSAFTTVVYQPLELLKTRIQLSKTSSNSVTQLNRSVIGLTTKSALQLIKESGIGSLWRGTGASLVRSVPGIGLYYASLNILQTNFSDQNDKPNNSAQAFCFGLVSRSVVSLTLLPVTSIKARYESGHYRYPSLALALKDAYLRNGWVGIAPTILRDSLFSGIYYMSYTELKIRNSDEKNPAGHMRNFLNGILSGLLASILTNPLDVLKTNIQVNSSEYKTMRQTASSLIRLEGSYRRFFDGLVPRSLRRTLIAATTWTFYELMTENLRLRGSKTVNMSK